MRWRPSSPHLEIISGLKASANPGFSKEQSSILLSNAAPLGLFDPSSRTRRPPAAQQADHLKRHRVQSAASLLSISGHLLFLPPQMPNTDARLLQTVSNNRSVDAFHQSSYASTLFQTTQTKKSVFFLKPRIPTMDHSPQMTSTSGRTKYCRSDQHCNQTPERLCKRLPIVDWNACIPQQNKIKTHTCVFMLHTLGFVSIEAANNKAHCTLKNRQNKARNTSLGQEEL